MFGIKNIAIMGCGSMADAMAKTIKSVKGAKVYACASREKDKAIGFATRNSIKKAYGSYEELVKDPKVDLVYIATPISEHYANARLCIEAGKAVIMEKAFTVNAAQAADLFELAENRHVFITEAAWIRYMPFLKTIKEVLASRVIGDPVMLQAGLGYNCTGIQRLWDPALAGGALLDIGVYPVNLAAMLFGTDIVKLTATCSYTEKHLDEQDSICMVYRDGKTASLSASMVGFGDRSAVIYGTKGFLTIANINNFESLTVYNNKYEKTAQYKRPKQLTGYEYEIQAALRALREGWLECPEMPHSETLKIMQIMDHIRKQLGIVYPSEQEAAIEEKKRKEQAALDAQAVDVTAAWLAEEKSAERVEEKPAAAAVQETEEAVPETVETEQTSSQEPEQPVMPEPEEAATPEPEGAAVPEPEEAVAPEPEEAAAPEPEEPDVQETIIKDTDES